MSCRATGKNKSSGVVCMSCLKPCVNEGLLPPVVEEMYSCGELLAGRNLGGISLHTRGRILVFATAPSGFIGFIGTFPRRGRGGAGTLRQQREANAGVGTVTARIDPGKSDCTVFSPIQEEVHAQNKNAADKKKKRAPHKTHAPNRKKPKHRKQPQRRLFITAHLMYTLCQIVSSLHETDKPYRRCKKLFKPYRRYMKLSNRLVVARNSPTTPTARREIRPRAVVITPYWYCTGHSARTWNQTRTRNHYKRRATRSELRVGSNLKSHTPARTP